MIGGTPGQTNAGKLSNVPPPAIAFTPPANRPAITRTKAENMKRAFASQKTLVTQSSIGLQLGTFCASVA
jgi:hypothetical protein